MAKVETILFPTKKLNLQKFANKLTEFAKNLQIAVNFLLMN